MSYLNDNVFQNIEYKIEGLKQYKNNNEENKKIDLKKEPLQLIQKEEIIDEFLAENSPE
jgi:hypothetical protein